MRLIRWIEVPVTVLSSTEMEASMRDLDSLGTA